MRSRSKVRNALLLGASLAGSLVAASALGAETVIVAGQAVQAEVPDIVVTGKKPDHRATLSRTRAISAAHDGLLPRFETPICPIVTGLPREYSEVVEQRIRTVASSIGLRLATGECIPNLTIVVTINGRQLIENLHRKRPVVFESLAPSDFRRLVAGTGPSWCWQQVIPKRRDGGPVEQISEISIDNGPPQQVSKGAYIASNVELSRLTSPVRLDTASSFVVLSAQALANLSLKQIADYSAFIGLAAIRTEATQDSDNTSIMTLFNRRADNHPPPTGMTRFDIAYLRALYSGSSGYSSDAKSAMMAGYISRALAAEYP